VAIGPAVILIHIVFGGLYVNVRAWACAWRAARGAGCGGACRGGSAVPMGGGFCARPAARGAARQEWGPQPARPCFKHACRNPVNRGARKLLSSAGAGPATRRRRRAGCAWRLAHTPFAPSPTHTGAPLPPSPAPRHGLAAQADTVPAALRWLPKVSLIKNAFQALVINEMEGMEFDADDKVLGAVEGVGVGARVGVRASSAWMHLC
jgi:hypothetical protein